MPIPQDLSELKSLFERLGARNPSECATSQLSEGIEHLHRYSFLRQAWQRIVAEEDTTWATDEINAAKKRPNDPYAGVGLALSRCFDKGVDPRDMTDIVRGMQAQLLFAICYLLEDPNPAEAGLQDVSWRLVVADKDFQPTQRVIGGLHESVLETDPSGREMRPRGA